MLPILIFLFYAIISICNGLSLVNSWENIHIICPNQCVCQYAHLMDLSIARWAQGPATDASKHTEPQTDSERNINNNEAYYEEDEINYEKNPFLKFAMCMLQDKDNGNTIKDVVVALPPDVQALVLLYNGILDNNNVSISISDLQPLTELTVLEIRGGGGGGSNGNNIGNNANGKNNQRSLQLILDDTLPLLRYANFESIDLIGSENLRRSQLKNFSSIHPSEVFDYVPESERTSIGYNISLEINEEIEIVPYDVYVQEQKKLKMASFYGWTNLRLLRIHNCKLDELHWEMFDGLKTLEHLSLEHNHIKIIPPFAFYGALHIKTLSLAHNDILDINYRSLAGLLDLERLDLSYNNLSRFSERSFPPFPKLQKCDFRNNPIEFIFPLTFGVMNNTRHIYLGSTDASIDLSMSHSFRMLNLLKTLFLLNVTTVTLTQQTFIDLTNLEYLKMHGIVKRIEFDAFAEMPKLKQLHLTNCKIQELSMDTFFGVKNLEILDLSKNKLQYLPPGLFDGQLKLKELYLNENQLTELPRNLFGISSLKLVRLIDNPWICSCSMLTWKVKLTNKVRGKKITPNCVYGLKTVANLKCPITNKSAIDELDFSYEFNSQLTPTCSGGSSDSKMRSVYYALRKIMKCNNEFSSTGKNNNDNGKENNNNKLKNLKYKHLVDDKMNYALQRAKQKIFEKNRLAHEKLRKQQIKHIEIVEILRDNRIKEEKQLQHNNEMSNNIMDHVN